MLVSIILTCYKQEKFIEETILSVIKQKYDNRELLIGDDSPDDNCRNIISKYTKKYSEKIHAWHHSPNKGIVNNMQFLLEQRNKKSEYVAFLEGDDSLFPEYLEKKLGIFNKYPNIQLVYNELTTIDEKGKIINKEELKSCTKSFCKKGKIPYEKLVSHLYYMSRSTLMIRSEMLSKYKIYCEDLGYNTILSDLYFFNQIVHNEDVYGIEEPLVYYRIHRDSVTKNMRGAMRFELEFLKYIEYLFEKQFINGKIKEKEVCRRYFRIGMLSFKKIISMGFMKVCVVFISELYTSIKFRYKKRFK